MFNTNINITCIILQRFSQCFKSSVFLPLCLHLINVTFSVHFHTYMSKQDKKFRINELLLCFDISTDNKVNLKFICCLCYFKKQKQKNPPYRSLVQLQELMALIPTDTVFVSEAWETVLHRLRMRVRSLSWTEPVLVVLFCHIVLWQAGGRSQMQDSVHTGMNLKGSFILLLNLRILQNKT